MWTLGRQAGLRRNPDFMAGNRRRRFWREAAGLREFVDDGAGEPGASRTSLCLATTQEEATKLHDTRHGSRSRIDAVP
jgi:hypothetical protein